jgi:hypothetical protein
MKTINAFLKPLTPEAEASLGAKLYQIPKFPFRIGRESRNSRKNSFLNSRRRTDSMPTNDLYLIEKEPPLNISREHFQIEWRDNTFFIIDRGSACGILVEGATIGGNRTGGQHPLGSGDVIIVGTSASRHIYKFIASP